GGTLPGRAGATGSGGSGRSDEGDRLHRTAPLWAAGGGVGVYLLVGGVPGALAGTVTAVVLTRVIRSAELPSARRRREELVAALPAVVDLVAAGQPACAAPERAHAQVDSAGGRGLAGDSSALGNR